MHKLEFLRLCHHNESAGVVNSAGATLCNLESILTVFSSLLVGDSETDQTRYIFWLAGHMPIV